MDMEASWLFKSLPVPNTVGVGLVAFSIYFIHRIISTLRRASSMPLPPGPRPMPFIGNLLDFPNGNDGPHWGKHKAAYGPISSVKVFGMTFIIVNDKKVTFDLLEKRSVNYSDRPCLPFAGQLVGFDSWVTPIMAYNNELKLHRRLFHNYFGTRSAMARFEKLEEMETRRFLLQVLRSPDNLMYHIRALPGTLILRMSHGYSTNLEGSDPLICLADEVIAEIFLKACASGTWTVDILPFVRHLPEWLPGMGFKRKAREWKRTANLLYDLPYSFVQHQIANGKAKNSFVSENIENGRMEDVGEHVLKSAAASMYGGGADTTVSALTTFYLAMVLYPDALKRAQEEIDRVIGPDRLPTFSDRVDLPYVEALLKETLRWENVAPINLVHMVKEDDTYMGYSIPKGALVLANIWQMTHDPEIYDDPSHFRPERFLGENGRAVEPDPRSVTFGFGRRICPGKELADNSLFIAIAMSVAVFDIAKLKDKFGNDIEPRHEYVPGLIVHPKPFQCSVKPRSNKADSLIRSIIDEITFEKGDSDVLANLSDQIH